jgi:hypothetical protein
LSDPFSSYLLRYNLLQSVTPVKSIYGTGVLSSFQAGQVKPEMPIFYRKGGTMVRRKFMAACMALMLSGTMLFTGCRHPSAGHRAERMVSYLTGELDLDNHQQEVLQRLAAEWKKKHEDMRKARREGIEEILEQFKEDSFSRDVILGRAEAMKPRMEESIEMFADGIAEFHSVLRPDQRSKLVAKLEDFKKLHDHFHN